MLLKRILKKDRIQQNNAPEQAFTFAPSTGEIMSFFRAKQISIGLEVFVFMELKIQGKEMHRENTVTN